MSTASDCLLWLKLWWWRLRHPDKHLHPHPHYARYSLEKGVV